MQGPLKSTNIKLGKTLAVGALLCAVQGGLAGAAGLGKINVLSRYGQPFVAEIDLINVTRDELATLNASLAPTSAYLANNLRFDPSLNSLRMSVERRSNGTHYVRATTTRRVNEPYVDLVVDLTWQGGKFQRHYTALMDLPQGNEAVAASASPAASAQLLPPQAPAPASSPARPAQAPAAPSPAAAAVPATANDRLQPLRVVPARKAVTQDAAPPPAPPSATAAKGTQTAGAQTAITQTPPQMPVKPGETAAATAKPEAAPVAPSKAETAKSADVAAPATAPANASGKIPDAPPAQTTPQPGDPKPESKPEAKAAEPASAPASSLPEKRAPAVTPPPSQRGWMAALMDYWLLVVAVLLALAVGLIGFLFLRRRDAERVSGEPGAGSTVETPPVERKTPSPTASAFPVRTDITDPPAVTPPPAKITVANSSDVVDPLDEAKVYVAYGQYEEAEKVLRAALSKQRGREDVQVTLLEILAEQGDKEGFNKVAGDMHKRTGGRGENWKRVAAMGYALDPAHPLYPPTAEAVEAAEATRRAAAPAETEVVVFDLTTREGQAEALASEGAAPRPETDSVAVDDGKTLGRAGVEFVSTAPPPPSDVIIEFPQAAATAVGAADEVAASKDIASIDFSMDFPKINLTSPPAKETRDAGIEFKLDVPAAAPQETPAVTAADVPPKVVDDLPVIGGAFASGIDAGFDTGDAPHDDHWHDVEQKFDLVRAYQEMGDTDGVREVLAEIEAEGNAQQKAEARKRLLALADT